MLRRDNNRKQRTELVMRSCRRSFGSLAVMALVGLMATGSAEASLSQGQSKFAALRQAPTSAPPASVARFLASKAGREGRPDASQTRRIAAPGGGWWDVIPGDGVICLFVESEQTGGCASTADALAGRLNMQFVEPSNDFGEAASVPVDTDRYQAGLLPDDVVSIAGSSKLGGSVVVRPNKNGLYRLSGTGGIGTVTMHRFNKRASPIAAGLKWKTKRSTSAKPTAKAAACPCADFIPAGYSSWAFYAGGNYGPYGGIWYVSVSSYDTNTICGNTRNPNQTWAGNFFCTTSAYGVSHLYNGSGRSGWAGPGAPSASVAGSAVQQWN